MVTGFKDSSGKFHPINQQKGVSRKSRVRYSNGAGSAQEIDAEVRNFGTKIRDRYNKFKAEQQEEFKRETAIRRKYGGKLITAYRLAQKQQVKDGRDLEKFIRRQIPDLPKDKSTNRFVVNLLREFKKSVKNLEKKKKGKSEDEIKALQSDFEDSLVETQALFDNQQKDQEAQFERDEVKRKSDLKKKIEKQNKEAKEAREAEDERVKKEREAEQAKEDAKKAEQEAKQASEDEKKRAEADAKQAEENAKRAEQEAKQAEQEAQKEEKQAENFSTKVFDELKMEEDKLSQPDFDFGFPEEIV